jgi:hypothetical protein
MTVWVYVNTSKQGWRCRAHQGVRHQDAAETWFEENDPEGVAFEYEVLERTGPDTRRPSSRV